MNASSRYLAIFHMTSYIMLIVNVIHCRLFLLIVVVVKPLALMPGLGDIDVGLNL